MSEVLHHLNGLGWEWRENGAILRVSIDGRQTAVFVPLRKIWHAFNDELASVGCPLSLGVGEPFTVGGLFGSIVKAVSSAGKSVAKATGVTAVAKAASKVATVAKNYGAAALNVVAKVPLIGPLAKSTSSLMLAPLGMADALARGGRIDKVVLGSLKQQLKDVKQIAPYVQTVMSVVPGVGQGLSGALGASLALADGQSLNDAFIAGVKGAIPGGPLVQAAAGLALDAMQGKPIADSVLNNLPLAPQAKQAIRAGLSAAQAMARGQRVDQALLDNALKLVPPQYQKAIQVGAAIGHAKSLQDAAGKAVSAAGDLARDYKAGQLAQAAARAIPRGLPTPPALASVIAKARAATATTNKAIAMANQGNAAARQIVAALKSPIPSGGIQRVGTPTRFVPVYIGQPLPHQGGPAVGGLFSSIQRAARFNPRLAPQPVRRGRVAIAPVFTSHRPVNLFGFAAH